MKKHSRDLLQNTIITLLTVSAVLLFAQSQLYTLGLDAGSSYLHRFIGKPTAAESTLHDQTPPVMAPVDVAVTGTYGRYGCVDLTTADPRFEPLGALLREVLGSSRTFSPSTAEGFQAALTKGSSVYYDFGVSLPLPILAEYIGTTVPDTDVTARRLTVSDRGGDSVTLYLRDESGTYLQCDTAVSRQALADTVSQYELGDACFAMDDSLPDSQNLAPLTLIQTDMDVTGLPQLTASTITSGSDRLLTALNFNPRTNLRYPDADGTEVIVEGERTLRISPTGQILYQSGGEDILTISNIRQLPSLRQAAIGTGALLNNILGCTPGDSCLYLRSIQQTEHLTTLEFDYHISGIPVLFPDDAPAAQVILEDNVVNTLRLRYRQYTVSAEPSLLLPLRQAMAVAGREPGTELFVGYVDLGEEAVSARWLTQ